MIDEHHGEHCLTHYAQSAFDNLDLAVENLRQRERMPSMKNVGFVNLLTGEQSLKALERHQTTVERISAWAEEASVDAVIWTALGRKFKVQTGTAFSPEAAIGYLSGLEGEKRKSAFDYIRQAPDEIQTPVRAGFAERWGKIEY